MSKALQVTSPESAVCFGTDEEQKARARAQFIELKGPAMVTCGCGHRAPVRFMFQCLYCNQWFCKMDAEAHFGKTVEQYQAEKELEKT